MKLLGCVGLKTDVHLVFLAANFCWEIPSSRTLAVNRFLAKLGQALKADTLLLPFIITSVSSKVLLLVMLVMLVMLVILVKPVSRELFFEIMLLE